MASPSVRARNLPEVPAHDDGVGLVECRTAVARRDKRAFIHGPFMSRKVEPEPVHRARERERESGVGIFQTFGRRLLLRSFNRRQNWQQLPSHKTVIEGYEERIQ